MKISFAPMRCDERIALSKSNDVLTINGETFDFGPLPDGATLPRAAVASPWLASDVERIDGIIHLTLILPHGPNAPRETLFPTEVRATDGDIILPPYDAEEEVAQ